MFNPNQLKSLSHYEKIISKDRFEFAQSFKNDVTTLFDQDKWEDRLCLLAFVMMRSQMKIDNRISFSEWSKKEMQKITVELDSGIKPSVVLSNLCERSDNYTFNSKNEHEQTSLLRLFMKWKRVSDFERKNQFTLKAWFLYNHCFPDNLVKKTTLGEYCIGLSSELAKESEIKDYLDSVAYSLVSTIENLYTKAVKLKDSGEEMFLYKGDIDWKALIDLRWRLSLLTWWYQEYCIDSYFQLFDIEFMNKKEIEDFDFNYVANYLLYRLFKAYGVNWKDYLHDSQCKMYSWYCNDPSDIDLDSDLEDSAEMHRYWISEYGEL